MTKKLRHKLLVHKLLVYLLTIAMVFGPVTSVTLAQADPIVVDNRTDTFVNVHGSITDVRTETLRGATGYNSFSRFNVPGGTTANLHVPESARNLVNLVHNERSFIDGTLNSYMSNGQIGGNVYFLNPHGTLIGQSGVVNVGSFHLFAPTQQFMEDLITRGGEISAIHERQLFEGNVPLSNTGLISVKGRVNAVYAVTLAANNVNVDAGASVRAGHQVQLEFGSIVNTQNLQTGNAMIMTPEGKISIVAAQDVNVAGRVAADGVQGESAGSVDIRAGNDIHVNTGAEISARGVGQGSDGGEVIIFADRNSYLQDGAVVDVSAGNGKGGFLEFSAIDTVNIVGNGLRSSAGGTVLIDPKHINLTGIGDDFYTNGASWIFTADESITLTNVLISSRHIDGAVSLTGEAKRNAHKEWDSTGNSGYLTFNAKTMEMINSVILAHATGDSTAGDVNINLKDKGNFDFLSLFLSIDFLSIEHALAQFSMDEGSMITGRNVTIDVEASRGTKFDYADGEWTGEGGDGFMEIFSQILKTPLVGVEQVSATAKIDIDGVIIASDNVNITAEATANSDIHNFAFVVGVGVGLVDAKSEIFIRDNAIINAKKGDVNIVSHVQTSLNIASETSLGVNKIIDDITKGVIDIFVPGLFSFAGGTATSINKIDIAQKAVIESASRIQVNAITTRYHNLEADMDWVAIALFNGTSDTDLIVNGTLTAGSNIDLTANTITDNSIEASAGSRLLQWLTDQFSGELDRKEMSDREGVVVGGALGIIDAFADAAKATVKESMKDVMNSVMPLDLAISAAILIDTVTTDITVGGTLMAMAGGIDISSLITDTVTQRAEGYALNFFYFSGGSGVAVMNINDHATTTILDNASLYAKDIAIETKVTQNIDQYARAGSIAIPIAKPWLSGAVGVSVGIIDIDSNVRTVIGKGSVLANYDDILGMVSAESITLNTGLKVDKLENRVGAYDAASLIGLGVMVANTSIGGITQIDVKDNVNIYGNNITLTANDVYKELISELGGGGLALVGLAANGAWSDLDIRRNSMIDIGEGVTISGGSIDISAHLQIDKLENNMSAWSAGVIALAGVWGSVDITGRTQIEINDDSEIFATGDITIKAEDIYKSLKSDFTGGGVGIGLEVSGGKSNISINRDTRIIVDAVTISGDSVTMSSGMQIGRLVNEITGWGIGVVGVLEVTFIVGNVNINGTSSIDIKGTSTITADALVSIITRDIYNHIESNLEIRSGAVIAAGVVGSGSASIKINRNNLTDVNGTISGGSIDILTGLQIDKLFNTIETFTCKLGVGLDFDHAGAVLTIGGLTKINVRDDSQILSAGSTKIKAEDIYKNLKSDFTSRGVGLAIIDMSIGKSSLTLNRDTQIIVSGKTISGNTVEMSAGIQIDSLMNKMLDWDLSSSTIAVTHIDGNVNINGASSVEVKGGTQINADGSVIINAEDVLKYIESNFANKTYAINGGAGNIAKGNIMINRSNKIDASATISGGSIDIHAGLQIKELVNRVINTSGISFVDYSETRGYTFIGGKTQIDMRNNANLYSGDIHITAKDEYQSLKNYIVGAGAAAIGIDRTKSELNIDRDTKVSVGDNAFFGIKERPDQYNDSINIIANAMVEELVNQSAVKMIGALTIGHNSAESILNLNTGITLGNSTFRTGKIELTSSESINALVNALLDIRAGIGIPSMSSNLLSGTNNTINLNGTTIDAWGLGDAVKITAGGGTNILNATAYLTNISLIPVFSAPDANATLDINSDLISSNVDTINFTGTNISSVADILVEAGKGKNTVIGYSEGTDAWRKAAEAVAAFFGQSIDLTLYGGKSKDNSSNSINFKGNNNLVAGSHYNPYYSIDFIDGKYDVTLTAGDPSKNVAGEIINRVYWFDVPEEVAYSMSLTKLFQNQIDSLKNQIIMADSFTKMQGYQVEMDALRNQLRFYGLDVDANGTVIGADREVTIIPIAGIFEASSGDIRLNATNINSIGTKNELTANYDPSITIVNNSTAYLTFGEIKDEKGNIVRKETRLAIEDRLGGRVMQNGKIITAGDIVNKNDIARDYDIVFNSVDAITPFSPSINIYNTQTDADLRLVQTFISNPGGSVNIVSKGSIWAVEGTAINARDVNIATGGSFYQSYGDGRLDTGGNPFNANNVSSSIYAEILKHTLFNSISTETLNEIASILANLQKDIEGERMKLAQKEIERDKILDGVSEDSYMIGKSIELSDAETALTTAQDALTSEKDVLGEKETALADAKGVSDEKDRAWTEAKDVFDEKDQAWKGAKAALEAELDKDEKDQNPITLAQLLAAVTDAEEKKGLAQDGVIDAEEARRLAQEKVADAQDDFETAQGKVIDAQNNLNTAQDKVDDVARDIGDFKNLLATIKMGENAISALESFSDIGAYGDITIPMKNYNNAVMELQSKCTSDSWDRVFGAAAKENERGNTNLLVPKSGTLAELWGQGGAGYIYDQMKGVFETALTSAAAAYVRDKVDPNNGSASIVDNFNSGVRVLLDDVLPNNPSSTIYGARSVFISAETLNVNGTIKSGKTNFEPIDLSKIDISEGTLNHDETIDLTRLVFLKEYNEYNQDTDKYNTSDDSTLKTRLEELNSLVDKPTITYKAGTDGNAGTIVISNLVAYGGDITLYGNIISTGNGRIEVADGFGNIEIIGHNAYNLELGKVDMGGEYGLEGIIRLIDLGKMATDNTSGNSVPLTTIYTRGQNGINVERDAIMRIVNGKETFERIYDSDGNKIWYDVTSIYAPKTTPDGLVSSTKYDPKKDRWLQTTMGTDYSLEWSYGHTRTTHYKQWSSGSTTTESVSDVYNLGKVEGRVDRTKPVGTFLVDKPEFAGYANNTLLAVFDRQALDAKPTGGERAGSYDRVNNTAHTVELWVPEFYGKWWEVWKVRMVLVGIDKYGSVVETRQYDYQQRATETFDSYLNASRAIDIIFTGNQNPNNAGVTISGANTITLTDLIRTSQTASITAGGDIVGTDNAIINAQNVNLMANNIKGIGNSYGDALKLEALPGQGIGLAATTTNDMNIYATRGNMLIDVGQIKDKDGDIRTINGISGNNVTLRSDGDILQRNVGILAHNNLNLNAGGRIGHETADKMDLSVENNVIMRAVRNIDAWFASRTGADYKDLHAESIISTAGDVNLKVERDLLDKNEIAIPDPLSDAEKARIWGGLADDERKMKEDRWEVLTDEGKQNLWKELSDIALSEKGWENLSDAEIAARWATLPDEEKEAVWKGDIGWTYVSTAKTLTGSIFFSDAGTRNNTTSMIEEPNIAGHHVTLEVGGAIGQESADAIYTIVNGGRVLDKDDAKTSYSLFFALSESELAMLSDEQKEKMSISNLTSDILSLLTDARQREYEQVTNARRALADAEWGDVDINGDTMTIRRYDNINIEATGTLTTKSGGWTNIGSQGDIEINNDTNKNGNGIVVGGINENNGNALRLKTDGTIFASVPHQPAIFAANAILEAAGGTLGLHVDSPLTINLTGINDDSWIVARGTDGVYLSFVNASGNAADVNIREIGSTQGDVYLWAASMFADLPEGMSRESAKIGGHNIVLVALGDIGKKEIPLRINQIAKTVIDTDTGETVVDYGSVSLTAEEGSIYVYGTTSLDITKLLAGSGFENVVDLRAKGYILFDTDTDIDVNVGDGSLFMEAVTGINAKNGTVKIIAALLDAQTEDGDLIIDVRSDVLLKNIVTQTGSVDIYVDGRADIQNIAAGNDILLGADRDILFASNSNVNAGNNITMISARGNILSGTAKDATAPVIHAGGIASLIALTGRIGGTDIGSPFTANLSATESNLIGYEEVNVLNINRNIFDVALAASRNEVIIASKAKPIVDGTLKYNVVVDRVVTCNLRPDYWAEIIDFSTNFELSNLFGFASSNNPSNQQLLGLPLHININEQVYVNKTHGGALTFDVITFSDGTDIIFETDNLIVGLLTGSGDVFITHFGVDGERAESTAIGNIITSGSATFNKLYSDNVTIFTDGIDGILRFIDGQVENINVVNRGRGGRTHIDSLLLADGFFEVNNLAAGSLRGGKDINFSHVGVNDGINNGIADTTVINNITTPGTMTFEQLYSSDATIFSDSIGGVLDIVDGQVGQNLPGRLDLNINGIHTRLDSRDKLRDPSYDFWLWTVDGSYSLTSHSDNVTFPRHSPMRLLDGYTIFLPHHNTAVPHLLANTWLSEEYLSMFGTFDASPSIYDSLFGRSPLDEDEEELEEEIDALSRVMNDVLSAVQR